MLSKLFERLPSIGSFRDEFHIGLISDQRGDAFAEKGMVIYGQNSNHRSCFLPGRRKRRPSDVRYAIDTELVNPVSLVLDQSECLICHRIALKVSTEVSTVWVAA